MIKYLGAVVTSLLSLFLLFYLDRNESVNIGIVFCLMISSGCAGALITLEYLDRR